VGETGGTLGKGLNRAFATLVAGFIAVGAHQVANRCGAQGEPILLAIFVFLLGTHTCMFYGLFYILTEATG
jgi:hypothetical protein